MNSCWRWDPCLSHCGPETRTFIDEYFADDRRRILLVAGAGFDPRSTHIPELLSRASGSRLQGYFVREERPDPVQELLRHADQNEAEMVGLVPNSSVARLDVFAGDGAVIGGREITKSVQRVPLDDVTDIVVDTSALTIGVSYPAIKLLYERLHARLPAANLHIMVVDHPVTDRGISPIASDRVDTIHGFRGGFGLDTTAQAARLWVPQLVPGRRAMLERLHVFADPDDVCPILPFPASNPRRPDELFEYYAAELESTWEVDARSMVYADERDPLDLYRTLLRIDTYRRRVFGQVGGSMMILSPLGSKALAIGALMAAIERDLPVAYVEAVGYRVEPSVLAAPLREPDRVLHLWLCGEPYHAQATPACSSGI